MLELAETQYTLILFVGQDDTLLAIQLFTYTSLQLKLLIPRTL